MSTAGIPVFLDSCWHCRDVEGNCRQLNEQWMLFVDVTSKNNSIHNFTVVRLLRWSYSCSWIQVSDRWHSFTLESVAQESMTSSGWLSMAVSSASKFHSVLWHGWLRPLGNERSIPPATPVIPKCSFLVDVTQPGVAPAKKAGWTKRTDNGVSE